MIRGALFGGSILVLAGCSEIAHVCEEVEPWRPLIRGAITIVEPAAAIPFVATSRVSCGDLEKAVERLRDQR